MQIQEKSASRNPMLLRRRTSRHISTQLRITPGVPGMIAEMTVAMTAKASSITDAGVIAAGADVGAVAAGVIAVAVHRAVRVGGTFRHPSMLRRRVANFATTTIATSS